MYKSAMFLALYVTVLLVAASATAGTVINRDPYPHTVRIEGHSGPGAKATLAPGEKLEFKREGILELDGKGEAAGFYGDATVIIFQDSFALRDLTYQRMKDLTMLRAWLEAYLQDHDEYPVSDGWSGLHSTWGYSGPDWIPGLTPDYVKELPRDPREDSNPEHQYLYKSDGEDYKIIAHRPDDFDVVTQEYPELIDPVRPEYAYGFWTSNAEKW